MKRYQRDNPLPRGDGQGGAARTPHSPIVTAVGWIMALAGWLLAAWQYGA